jgi:DNA invertase Pin-like site-specific DNA recombinase
MMPAASNTRSRRKKRGAATTASPEIPATGIVNVIYARFSSELQRTESIQDQVRRCREALTRMGIDPGSFIVLADEAVSGTPDSRPAFDVLKALLYDKRLGSVVVSEQSRLSRGDNAKALVKDIVFHGGRFISVAEGVDTSRKGWRSIVGLSEIHHARSSEDTAERVRGGQEGRVRDGNGSAGDFPYGYASEYAEPVAAAAYRGRGPKPKRVVVIEPAAAALVREVFRRFTAANQSMGEIVRWWHQHVSEHPPIFRKAGCVIRIDHVRRMLRNRKYTGTWPWGETTIVYDGNGNKKQVAARPDQTVTVVQRPALRIVEQAVWAEAQAKLKKLQEIHGRRPEGSKRGPAEHYRKLYAKSLLHDKVTCALCGGTMRVAARRGSKWLCCPNRKLGRCSMAVRLPYMAAQRAVLGTLAEVLGSYPDWVAAAAVAARERLAAFARSVPAELAASESELTAVNQQLERLVDAVASGTLDGPTVRGKLQSLEGRKATLTQRLAELRQSRDAQQRMPDDAWIADQLKQLTGLLAEQMPVAAPHLRPMLAECVAEQALDPGCKRGHCRLRFAIDRWELLSQALDGRVPAAALAGDGDASAVATGSKPGEFIVDFRRGSCAERWGERIAAWRAAGVEWDEIGRRSSLKPRTAAWALRQWRQQQITA